MKIGYARVSTEDQHLTFQLQVLKEAGCQKIYQEKISGAHGERKELSKLLENLREGDTLIVWRLDRLARSTKKLLEITDNHLTYQETAVVESGLIKSKSLNFFSYSRLN